MIGNGTSFKKDGDFYVRATVLNANIAASGDIHTKGASSIRVDFTCFAITGTSITPRIQGYSDAKGDWVDLLTAAAITGAGDAVLNVSCHMPAASNITANAILPKRVRINLAKSGLTSAEFAASYTLD